ncbi:MAG TPA: GNVR domain-containing protein [Gemmatimonadales bacterium]|nr:GNVR domain-containing protein [Gemmatimonadales bacterium]
MSLANPPVVGDTLSARSVLSILLPRWRFVALVVLISGVLGVLASFLVTSRYRAVAIVAPVGRRMPQLPAALAGVAGQFLQGVGTGEGVQTPGYYVQVLRTDGLMREVLLTPFPAPRSRVTTASSDSIVLLDYLVEDGKPLAVRLDAALKILRKRLSVSADNQTSIIRIGVELPDRELAASVANAFVERLNAFNLRTAREQARQRRVFAEERRNELARELRDAEEQLRAFLVRNRLYQNDPDLQFQFGRLERQVQLRQEMYLTLSRAYEQMRVEETNDVPPLTVIDSAVAPVKRSYPSRRVWLVLSLALGLTMSVTYVSLRTLLAPR